MKIVFASALVAAATALPWEDSQYGWDQSEADYASYSYHNKIVPEFDPVLIGNKRAETTGSVSLPSLTHLSGRKYKLGTGETVETVEDGGWADLTEGGNPATKDDFCKYFSVHRDTYSGIKYCCNWGSSCRHNWVLMGWRWIRYPVKGGGALCNKQIEGSSAIERNLVNGGGNTNLVQGPNVEQWTDVQTATKSKFCKACFGGDDVQTTARFCKSCFGGDVEVQTKFCKACFGGDDVETQTNFCKSCFGGDDAEVKARFCKSCFGGDDVETTARFCKSCFGGDDAEVKARFCKSCFGGDDVATTVAFCKACFGGDDAEVKARFCKSCFGGDVETHARFCKSCFGGDDAEVHSRFCKSCFGGDVQARVKCDCSNVNDKSSADHYGIDNDPGRLIGAAWMKDSIYDSLKYLLSVGYTILAAAHACQVSPDGCECALSNDSNLNVGGSLRPELSYMMNPAATMETFVSPGMPTMEQ